MTEGHAYALALRVTRTAGYSVHEVRRAWSAMWAWHVAIEDHRTGERLLLLSEDQFDSRLTMEAGQPKPGEITTAQSARPEKRAVAHHS